MPLANDDASAAARGRHVVSVGVATRSSSGGSSNSSSSSTYVADRRHSPPAGHPRAPEITLPLPLTIPPRHLHAARRYPTHRAGCCSRGMILRIPSPSPQSPLGDPKTKPARARRCSPTDRVTRPGILVRASAIRKLERHRSLLRHTWKLP